jgi:hypothetical protein
MASRAFLDSRLGSPAQAKRESVVITKHGKPVAKLVPADQNADDIYNFLAGKGTMIGDVVFPAISDEEWGN